MYVAAIYWRGSREATEGTRRDEVITGAGTSRHCADNGTDTEGLSCGQ